MSTLSSARGRDESGVALVAVLLAVIILGGLAAVFVATSIAQTRASGIGRDLESAVHVAEAATDDVIMNLNDDLDYRTSYDGGSNDHIYLKHDGDTYTDEKTWARAVADSLIQTQLTASGGGEGVAIRPLDSLGGDPMDLVFGVGYVPSRTAALAGQGRIRVLKLQVQPSVFSPADAFLANGDLTLGGQVNTDGITGNVHANGDVFVEGASGECSGSGLCVRGHLSAVGELKKGPAPTGPAHTDSEQAAFDNKHVCPVGDTAPTCGSDDITEGAAEKHVPDFNAVSFYDPTARLGSYTDPVTGNVVEARWWILCPAGTVFAPAFDADGSAKSPQEICAQPLAVAVWSGQTANFNGWARNNNCSEFGKACWHGDKIVSGAYFIYNSNARSQGGRGAVSILVSCEKTPTDGAGRWDPDYPDYETCGSATPGDTNGNYSMSGQPTFVPALRGVHFLADRDIIISGQAGTKLDGFIGAREQVAASGQGDLSGSIVSLEKAHTPSSPVALSSAKGNFKVSYNERLLIALPGITQITAWNEL